MNVDRSSFLALVAGLAAGAGGGYYASQSGLFGARAPITGDAPTAAMAATTPAPPSAPPTATTPREPAGPPCDDSTGSPGACPPAMGSADEGGCGDLPLKRCNDFKKAFEPKVAENAVACLNALKPGERCDASRLNLCGHLALMNACTSPGDGEAPTSGAAPVEGGVDSYCNIISGVCGARGQAPKLRDCRATLAGMSDAGRSAMVDCMKAHCADKGLLGCEAVMSGGT